MYILSLQIYNFILIYGINMSKIFRCALLLYTLKEQQNWVIRQMRSWFVKNYAVGIRFQ